MTRLTTRKLWVDTDMGFDDLAGLLALQHAPGVEIVGVSLVAGNAPLDEVRNNAQRAAACFGWQFPIHLGAAKPLACELVTAQNVLGHDGMGSAGITLPTQLAPLHPQPAVDAMPEAFSGAEPFDLLALGPLTNVAQLLQRPTPALQSLWWMGGSFGAGNHTAAAEFNAFVDPEAAQICVEKCAERGIAFHMVGLDACRQVQVTVEDCNALRRAPGKHAQLLADLLLGYVQIGGAAQSMNLYDPTAAAAWLHPNHMQFKPAHLVVECIGQHTRGMTVCEFRVPRKAHANAQIASLANAQGIRHTVLAALAAAADGF